MIALLLFAQLAVAPKASFAATCVPSANQYTLDASASTRGTGGPIVSYRWNWGNGRTETQRVPVTKNTWQVASRPVVKLTVVDSSGRVSNVTQKTITVPCPAATKQPPIRVDTVRLPAPPAIHDTIQLPAPPAVHDTVRVPCVCDTTKPPPIVTPPPVVPPTPPPTGEVVAELPRVTLSTTMQATTGKVISVPAGGDLQAALNAAQPCDAIELANGATYTGNFILPVKSGACTIVIRPANLTVLPPEGSRLNPVTAGRLPRLVGVYNQGVFQTAPGAHHWRLVGLEVTATITTQVLVSLGEPGPWQSQVSQIPHDIVLDRMYVHGAPTLAVRRGVVLNCSSCSVIDSNISEIHDNNGDSQAILGYNGPGPFAIHNNYLESGGEVVMFGGGDPGIYLLVPSDITITRNHITTNPAWTTWLRKNLLEFKSAQRVLIEGNVFESMPQGGQVGGVLLFKSSSAGGGSWQGTQDVTVRKCVIRGVRSGITIESIPEPTGTPRLITTSRITIEDVLGYDIGQQANDVGIALYLVGNPADVLLRHVTVLAPNSALTLSGAAQRLRIRDSYFGASFYPLKGDGVTQGQPTLDAYAPGAFVAGNVIVLGDQSAIRNFPANNFYPATNADIAPDFTLISSSRYKGKATDGRDPGANVAAILAATAGVVQ